MILRTLRRRVAALLGMAAVAFAQFAFAMHPCEPTQQVAAAAPCHVPAGAPSCAAHCARDAQDVDSLHPVALPDFIPAFIVALAPTSDGSLVRVDPDPSLLHPTSPPHCIRDCCWRA